jgi:hypothetical protein
MTGPASLYGLARSAPRFKSSNAAATAARARRPGLDGDPFVQCLRYENRGPGRDRHLRLGGRAEPPSTLIAPSPNSRPKTGSAMTAAERMRRYRARRKAK